MSQERRKQQVPKNDDGAKQDPEKRTSKVVQDSSIIREPAGYSSQESLNTLSKVEGAFPPKNNERVYPATSPLNVADDEYYMAHRFRGKAIIFNHYEYDSNLGLTEREGTVIDRNALEKTFKAMGFSVNILDDPTRHDIIKKLKDESDNYHLYKADCLIVVVLTHGKDDNTLFAKDSTYNVSELWAPFLADKCSVLATKPKIFIIQACRGDGISTKVDVNRGVTLTTTDSTKVTPEPSRGEYFSIPPEADILIAFSSFEGHVAYRNEEEGTWYISELCSELKENWESDDFLTMLTRVNRRVAINKECSLVKQMPSFQSTLTRKIFFSEHAGDININEKSITDLHKKIDLMITLQEKLGRLSSAQKVHDLEDVSSLKASTYAEWDGLRVSLDSSLTGIIPTGKEVILLAKGLRMFLQERNLKDEVYQNGSMILTVLSMWEQLDPDARIQASDRLTFFLQTHASQWPYYTLLNIPVVPGKDSEIPRSRRSSRASTSTQNASQPPKQKPFK